MKQDNNRGLSFEIGASKVMSGSWRDLWNYFGPALMVSVAYMDSGNYGTDISGGASFGYSMLWVDLRSLGPLKRQNN